MGRLIIGFLNAAELPEFIMAGFYQSSRSGTHMGWVAERDFMVPCSKLA
jgi:hypothetical protein